jgi:hypothetical protein
MMDERAKDARLGSVVARGEVTAVCGTEGAARISCDARPAQFRETRARRLFVAEPVALSDFDASLCNLVHV